jgi:hypothetical protein
MALLVNNYCKRSLETTRSSLQALNEALIRAKGLF